MWPRAMTCETSSDPLRIAIVYSRSPVPMRRADQMTVANLISYLHARGHIVDLYALRTGARVAAEDVSWLIEHCRTIRLYRHGRVRQMTGAAGALFRRQPLQVGIFHNRRQARDLEREVRGSGYDVVYTYYLRSAEATRRVGRSVPDRQRPVSILALQLSQSLNTARILETATRKFIRWLYRYERAAVANYESTIWRHFDRCMLRACLRRVGVSA